MIKIWLHSSSEPLLVTRSHKKISANGLKVYTYFKTKDIKLLYIANTCWYADQVDPIPPAVLRRVEYVLLQDQTPPSSGRPRHAVLQGRGSGKQGLNI